MLRRIEGRKKWSSGSLEVMSVSPRFLLLLRECEYHCVFFLCGSLY